MNDFIVLSKNKKTNVRVSENSEIIINENKIHYELIQLNNSTFRLLINQKFYDISSVKIDNDRISISVEGYTYELSVRTALQERAAKVIEQKGSLPQNKEVKAPMPGMILKVKKHTGELVNTGDSIIILEAMKMENDIKAPVCGTINAIYVNDGTAVEKGV